ncbi:wax ester/triacylglycerol synthase family O-acyltransferase [Pseudomonas sp. PDM23]|uniref:wax ester/triacylglycerol synthase family O-acyltransferase n=1 Tax=unclassified Pseudomonas TaxID=196821 RepID=UPI0017847ACF|nr:MULTISPECIES: wax ester/triacylglycerol synthase family O-acyltransferase [unclassified Pseudomonas]MBD9577733.1 wax ester/triacylglycerol synthase family O-acyltransferase [Pseudomonas sp. PDM23]MBD9672293.1 wax ester/triacylglycerol synthase family O-acyltransferase [Pseudomonas sp. PDM21]
MKQLTPMDAQFFYSDAPHQPMVIGGLWICDQRSAPNGLVRHKDIIRFIDSRLSGTSLFRRRLQHAPFRLDDPYWLEDKHFDLEYHIRHVGLPQPGDWRQLCIFTARVMSRSLDMERAPWDITIIEGLNNVEGVPPGSFALLLRFHHAYVDGKSGVEITTLLMDDQVEFDENPYRQPLNERMPTRAQMWAKTLPRLLGQSLRSARAGYCAARKSVQLAAQLRGEASPDQHRVPTTLFNAPVSPHRTYGATCWPIAELKQIRRCAPGATLNDVIIAIIAGGLRRYLLRREALPVDQSLVALCPVAMRPEGARRDMGNLISMMLIGMGTDLSDPQRRLQAITERTRRGGPLAREVMHELITSLGDMLPAPVRMLGGWLQNQVRYVGHLHLQNTLITNVPGPTNGAEKKYFAGAEILATYPIVPVLDGMGLSHGITSLYGQIILGVLADRQMLPDMDVYMACLQESTDEYLALARDTPPGPAEDRPAAPRRRSATRDQAEPGKS